jgi:hypothetical protein
MTYEDLQARGSGLGTGTMIVIDKDADLVRRIARAAYFLQARELRPVHAVPRRHRLDVAGDGADGHRRGRDVEIDLLLTWRPRSRATPSAALGDAAAWADPGPVPPLSATRWRSASPYRARKPQSGA